MALTKKCFNKLMPSNISWFILIHQRPLSKMMGTVSFKMEGWLVQKPLQEMFILLMIKWASACHVTTACDWSSHPHFVHATWLKQQPLACSYGRHDIMMFRDFASSNSFWKVLLGLCHLSGQRAQNYSAWQQISITRSSYMKFSKNKKARGTERQRAGGRRKVKRRQGLSKANPEQPLEAQQHLWCYFVITTQHPIILFLFSLAVRDNQCQLTLIIVIEFKINVVASMSVILYWYRKEICTPGVSCARLRIKKEFLTVNYR